MEEQLICIVTPQTRTYYRAVPVAKEFLDKEQNIVNRTGVLPTGAITEFTASTATLKHLVHGQLDGTLQVMNLADQSITFQEEYKNGQLVQIDEKAPAFDPAKTAAKHAPLFPGTTVKTSKGARSFYNNGKEVAEETIASNGITVELLGNIPDGEVKEIDDAGHVLSLAHYQHNKLNGALVRYNESGQVISREQYADGLLDGPAEYISFARKQPLIARCTYKNARLEGERTLTQQDGTVRCKESYKNGHLHGARVSFYPTGQKEAQETYTDGKLEGPRVCFFPGGEVWYKENYVKGRLDGQRTGYFADGKLFLEEYYTDGLLDGPRKTFSETGELLSNEEYHWGSLVHNTERRSL